jgi:NitT/TauT family transport system substrate-binding protein
MKISTVGASRRYRQALYLLTFILIPMGSLSLLITGCGKEQAAGPKTKLKVAYLGLTCEAPIFIAHDKGFYAEEGLEVELVKTDWDGLREGLGSGQFDANHTLIMYVLMSIEKGMDIKVTGGIHTGCLRIQVSPNSPIKNVKDLRGKTIGVPTHIGSPPFLFASRVLSARGIDPRVKEGGEVKWQAFPPDAIGKALADGRIDALATSDPIGTILLGKGAVRTIADQAEDAPYSEEYCCAVVISGKLGREHPDSAAKVTRAMLKAARWVEENPTAAAKFAVEQKYIAASAEINAQAIAKLHYIPAVAKCKKSVLDAALEMKQAGLLKDSTEPGLLAQRAWQDLDGVNDEWVKLLKVEKVADGGKPVLLTPQEFAAVYDAALLDGVCFRGCCPE